MIDNIDRRVLVMDNIYFMFTGFVLGIDISFFSVIKWLSYSRVHLNVNAHL